MTVTVRYRFAILAAAGLGAFAARPASALEGGQSPYLKGYRDFLSGVLPPPGVQVRNDLHLSDGRESSTIPPGELDVRLRSILNVFGATVVTPYRILGGNLGFAVRIAGSHPSIDRTVTRLNGRTTASGSLSGLNDMAISPFVIGWHAGNLHWNIATTVFVPVGRYDAARLANTGKNTWAWAPQAAVTYLDLKAGWEMSGAAGYIVSGENPATRYRSGDVVHVDAAWSRRVAPQAWLGVAGYAMAQVTDDGGAGNTLGARRARVFGLGPALRLHVRTGETPATVVIKYAREFAAENTTQGDALSVSVRIHF